MGSKLPCGSKVVAYMVLLAAWPDTDLDHEDQSPGAFAVFFLCLERLESRNGTRLEAHTQTLEAFFFRKGSKGGCPFSILDEIFNPTPRSNQSSGFPKPVKRYIIEEFEDGTMENHEVQDSECPETGR